MPPCDNTGIPPAQAQAQATQPTSSPRSPRPLRREGAVILLNDHEQELHDAMMRSSPPPELSILGKRPRQEGDQSDAGDTEPEDDGPSTTQSRTLTPTLSNIAAACLRYASKKKLRADQCNDLEVFLMDSSLGRQAKMFTCLMSLENQINVFQSAAVPFQVSDELKTNITNYALAVLLSVKISAYKGNIPRNHILDIIRKFRFDLPVGIEHDYASWEKIKREVSYALTQLRAKIKKIIDKSITSNQNIFALSQQIVQGTPCKVTVQLCARVAIMASDRKVHRECMGSDKYWNLIDERLEFIRKTAESSTSKQTRAFGLILKKDRELYGTHDIYEIKDTAPDELQQRVDDVVSGIVLVSG